MFWFWFKFVIAVIGALGAIAVGVDIVRSLDLVWYLHYAVLLFLGMVIGNVAGNYVGEQPK